MLTGGICIEVSSLVAIEFGYYYALSEEVIGGIRDWVNNKYNSHIFSHMFRAEFAFSWEL